MTGYESKRAAAQDKLVVTDLDGHVVRDVRKPKKAARDRDAEIERLNEKIEFLARTNMLYSDWEHRETQVTSDLIRKGIEEAKINAELRAEIAELKAQLVAQPAQDKLLDNDDALTIAYQSGYYDGKKAAHLAQEPVAWVDLQKEAQQIVESKFLWKRFIDGTPLSNDIACWMANFAQQHTAPPQRPWVGLTDEEIALIDWESLTTKKACVRAIEAKLKEKNT